MSKNLMWVLAVVLALLVLSVIGCKNLSSTAQKVGADIGVAAQKVCNFDLAASQEAQNAMNFISAAAPVVGAFIGAKITQAEALVTLNIVANAGQSTTCVLLTDLQNALDYFNILAAQYTAKTKGMKAFVNIPSLINLNVKLQAVKSMGK